MTLPPESPWTGLKMCGCTVHPHCRWHQLASSSWRRTSCCQQCSIQMLCDIVSEATQASRSPLEKIHQEHILNWKYCNRPVSSWKRHSHCQSSPNRPPVLLSFHIYYLSPQAGKWDGPVSRQHYIGGPFKTPTFGWSGKLIGLSSFKRQTSKWRLPPTEYCGWISIWMQTMISFQVVCGY